MNRGVVVALFVGLVGCAGDGRQQVDADGPAWWRFAADVDSPIGGDWQAGNGACLYAWHDRIEWDGEVTMCDMMDNGAGYVCLVDGNGYRLEPIDNAAGYLGPVTLTFPEGRTADLEPRCLK